MKRTRTGALCVLGAATALFVACVRKETPRSAPSSVPSAPASAPPAARYDRVERLEFNRRAAALDLPLFWRSDANGDKTLDPAELAVLASARRTGTSGAATAPNAASVALDRRPRLPSALEVSGRVMVASLKGCRAEGLARQPPPSGPTRFADLELRASA